MRSPGDHYEVIYEIASQVYNFYECVYWQIYCVTGKIYKFLKQICENMATNLEPRDRSDSLGRQSGKNRGTHSIRDDFVYESPMTEPVMNEVNVNI